MAASMVSIRICRSIPLSRATSSMMCPRLPSNPTSDAAMSSPVTFGGPAVVALAAAGRLRLPGRLPIARKPSALDLRGRNLVFPSLAFEHDETVFVQAFQNSRHHSLPEEGLSKLQLGLGSRKPCVVGAAVESSVDARRPDVESIASRHDVGDVERRREITGNLGAQIQRDAGSGLRSARALDGQIQ